MRAVPLQLSLLEAAPPRRRDVRSPKDRWFDRLRPALRERFAGQVITTDDLHRFFVERPDLVRPADVHANALGTLFSGWDDAEPMGYTRSTRRGANRNVLRKWKIR